MLLARICFSSLIIQDWTLKWYPVFLVQGSLHEELISSLIPGQEHI